MLDLRRKQQADESSHVSSTYPSIAVILEAKTAAEVHSQLACPVYAITGQAATTTTALHDKVDLVVTLGGDGTILRASSLFATCYDVPPVLSFSMGTLGFLSEWRFAEYKRAFREVYMSGAGAGDRGLLLESPTTTTKMGPTGWSSVRGKSMGSTREARILLRNRLKVGLFGRDGALVQDHDNNDNDNDNDNDKGVPLRCTDNRQGVYAMNEVVIHRGKEPHLAIVEVFVGGRFLTEAVADGMIVSTPTGSTAYSLSSGGSIIHPLVPSLLLTPICARSLSFRPLVLPDTTDVRLRLSGKNRGRSLDVSIDGMSVKRGMAAGMEVRVWREDGGVPCVMRRTTKGEADEGWVGGLNGMLKFNYPFGE